MAWEKWLYEGREMRWGRAWRDGDGQLHYYGRKAGVEVALGEEEWRAAEELRRFREDPAGYRTRVAAEHAATTRATPVYMGEDLVQEFLAWSLRTKGNTRDWVARQRGTDKHGRKTGLVFWADRFEGVDLRRLDLRDHVLPALEGPNRTHKIQILKRFLSWLRKEKHILSAAEDCTYGTLSAPQAKPAQWKCPKGSRDARPLDRVIAKGAARRDGRRPG